MKELDNERINEETSFINDDEYEFHDNSFNIIKRSNPKSRYSMVESEGSEHDYMPDVNEDAGLMRKSLINDRKKSFKKIFNVNLEKKNGPSNSILLDTNQRPHQRRSSQKIFPLCLKVKRLVMSRT